MLQLYELGKILANLKFFKFVIFMGLSLDDILKYVIVEAKKNLKEKIFRDLIIIPCKLICLFTILIIITKTNYKKNL